MEKAFPVQCAWCGVTIGQSSASHSHGICKSCRAVLLGVPLLTELQLDALPFGVIELDSKGFILKYNKAEEALSGLDSAHVVGRDFFSDVAPCTSVKKFKGRFDQFISSNSDPESFEFTFRFPGRTTKVHIAFVRSDQGSTFVFVSSRSGNIQTA